MFNEENLLKEISFSKGLRLCVMAGLILGFMVLVPMVATAKNPNPQVLSANSKPFGNTYGEWSSEWWEWVLSIPTSSNPILDTTGEFCAEGQSGKVWFLAGAWETGVERECTVPLGKAILIPIVNAECSTIQEDGEEEDELRDCANSMIDYVTLKEASVDGKDLQDLDDYRFESPLFEFTLPEDNILGINTEESGDSSNSVADGYWIMLAPPSAGEHTIYIHAIVEEYDFEMEVTYTIIVEK